MRVLWWMNWVTRKDKIRNDFISDSRYKSDSISGQIKEKIHFILRIVHLHFSIKNINIKYFIYYNN